MATFAWHCEKSNDSVYKLYNPSTTDMDIVFFHGLQLRSREDPVPYLSTWTSTPCADNGTVIWPQQWLPEDFPTARIWTTFYDGSPKKTHDQGRMDLHQVADSLAQNLRLAGVGHAHPVILIGHCLGGLVIKQLCLHLSVQHKVLLHNIKGVFYYATPQQGTCADLQTPVDPEEEGELVKIMRFLNKEAARLRCQFHDLVRDSKIQTAGVGETKPTNLGGRYEVIVPEASARSEGIVFVAEDHFSICQPVGKKSTTYVTLVDFIETVRKTLSLTEQNSLDTDIRRFPDLDNRRENMVERRKVLIFGKTGSGKSTLANMLVSGSLENPIFPMGNSMQGVTDECVTKEGLDYEVTDTVGFGEDTESERKNAQRLILEFMRRTHGSYHHILFVKRASAQDRLDTTVWRIFLEILKDYQDANQLGDLHRGIVLVLSHCREPQKWLQDNRRELQKYYSEVNNRFVAVDFPPIDNEVPALESHYSARRQRHLHSLKDSLDDYFGQNGKQAVFTPGYPECMKDTELASVLQNDNPPPPTLLEDLDCKNDGEQVRQNVKQTVFRTPKDGFHPVNETLRETWAGGRRRVLIFGSRGCGKSTLANMLVSENLENPLFPRNWIHRRLRTRQTEKGRGYEVTDISIPSRTHMHKFTEKYHSNSTRRYVRKFVKKASSSYHHILFVKKAATRQATTDADLWEMLQNRNEHGDIHRHITVVITHCPEPEKWLKENRGDLQRHYSAVEGRFIAVDFPPVDADEETEKIFSERRDQHLKRLKGSLDAYFRENKEQPVCQVNSPI